MGSKEKTVGPLIILHGWAYDTKKWGPFLRLLEQNGVECKMLKIPGLTAPLENVWTLDDYVSWLNRLIANSQKPAAILGHSNGGRIAAVFAAKHPDKISKLILIDSAGITHRDLKTLMRRTVFEAISKIGKRLTNSDSVRNLLYKVVREQDYNRANPILKKTMINLISKDLEPIFSIIKTPTLIIWGENDKITPLSDGIKIHELIPNSKFETIKNAKHSPQFTHPEEVFTVITNYFRGSTPKFYEYF